MSLYIYPILSKEAFDVECGSQRYDDFNETFSKLISVFL